MCGIFGLYCLDPKKANTIKKYIPRLLEASEERGTDASGIAFFTKNNSISYLKAPVKATELSKSKAFLKEMKENSPTILIGHTRSKTKGEPSNNDNNHPLVLGGQALVHNGCLWNEDTIFKEYKLKRVAEVDSEVILALINHFQKKEGLQIVPAIKKASKEISGSLAFAMISLKKKNNIYFVASSNPLCFAYSKKLKTVFFASTKDILEEALFEKETVFGVFETEKTNDFVFKEYRGILETGLTLTPSGIKTFEIERPSYTASYAYNTAEKEAVTTPKKEKKEKKEVNKNTSHPAFDSREPISKPSLYTDVELQKRYFLLLDKREKKELDFREANELSRIENTIMMREKNRGGKSFDDTPEENVENGLFDGSFSGRELAEL